MKINQGVQLFNKNLKICPNKNQINMIIDWCKINNIEINQNCLYLQSTFPDNFFNFGAFISLFF